MISCQRLRLLRDVRGPSGHAREPVSQPSERFRGSARSKNQGQLYDIAQGEPSSVTDVVCNFEQDETSHLAHRTSHIALPFRAQLEDMHGTQSGFAARKSEICILNDKITYTYSEDFGHANRLRVEIGRYEGRHCGVSLWDLAL